MERVLSGILLALLLYFVYLIFSPFLVALAWGIVLAIMFYPVHRRMAARIPRENLAALVTTLLVTVAIVVPTTFVMGTVAGQAARLVDRVQAEWEQGRMPFDDVVHKLPVERTLEWLKAHNINEEQIRGYVTKGVETLAGFLAGQTGALARNVFIFFFDLFVALFAAFYLFRDGPELLDRLRRILPLDHVHREGIFYITYNMVYASVVSGIVVAAAQGTLGGFVFWLLGIRAPALWGLVMAFFALLPIVGPWLVWVPAVLSFLVYGEYGRALLLLILGFFVISGVDNVLRPVLISGRAQMNGLLVFISILGGIAAFGFLGIVLGPIVVAVADALIEVYTAKQPLVRPAATG
jgi:predicted PurR-regulated permease PerM